MTSMSQENTASVAGTPGNEPPTHSSMTEPDSSGWTIISKPGAVVEISTRSMPDHIREAIARNLGIGTGTPREQ